VRGGATVLFGSDEPDIGGPKRIVAEYRRAFDDHTWQWLLLLSVWLMMVMLPADVVRTVITRREART
jgi:hypothetical protein